MNQQTDYTSIQERIIKQKTKLKIFGTSQRNYNKQDIPFALDDYISLVETTGRVIISEHKGYIPEKLPDILLRLGLNNDTWLNQIKYFDKWYYKAIGTVDNLKKYCQTLKQKYIKGLPKHKKFI